MKNLKTLKNLLLRRPVYVTFYVTKRCNFNCPMCAVKDQKMGGKINISRISRIAKRLKQLGVTIINIGGGEPLLVKELPEIIGVFKKDFSVRMQTNAYATDERGIRKLAEAGLDAVSVSLHSIFPEKQDSFCGVKGAWERIVRNMFFFSKYLPAREGILIMNSVVSNLNIAELPYLVKLANKIGFYSAFVPLLCANNKEDSHIYRTYAPHLRFGSEDERFIKDVYTRLIKLKGEGFGIANSTEFLKLSSDFLLDDKMRWRCDAGGMYFVLNHNGEFSICTEMLPIGNILDDNFFHSYGGDGAKREFKRLISQCPNCLHPCFAELTIMRNSVSALLEQSLKKLFFRRGLRCVATLDEINVYHKELLSCYAME